MMDKKEWIANIFLCLKEISDERFQERVWVKAMGPEISSYSEIMCMLYDDFRFDDFVKNNEALKLPDELFELLVQLNRDLSSYIEKDTDIEIINDPKWKKIRLLAKECVELFRQIIA